MIERSACRRRGMAVIPRRCVGVGGRGGDVVENAETAIATMTRTAAARARIDVRDDGGGGIITIYFLVVESEIRNCEKRRAGWKSEPGTSGREFWRETCARKIIQQKSQNEQK